MSRTLGELIVRSREPKLAKSGSRPTSARERLRRIIVRALCTAALCSTISGFAHALSVGGTVTGLQGNGLELKLNDIETLPIAANGTFAFASQLTTGDAYDVTINAHPNEPSQACVIYNGHGTAGSINITNVVIHCGPVHTYSVGGTLSGLASNPITLTINGGNPLTLAANGPFQFPLQFISGEAFVASVRTQPDGQLCTTANHEGVIGNAKVTNVNVSCLPGGPQLHLSVTDGGNYARYGQVRDYFVTLSNTGTAAANNVTLNADLDTSFDAANVHWTCVDGTPGTACNPHGAGGFADTATLSPGTSLVWIVRVPICSDSTADSASLRVRATGAADAIDTNTLVVFRDGYDVPYADGADLEDPAVRDAAVEETQTALLEGNG
jgi:uncharacterized repeat protein (TIGR01451 family)